MQRLVCTECFIYNFIFSSLVNNFLFYLKKKKKILLTFSVFSFNDLTHFFFLMITYRLLSFPEEVAKDSCEFDLSNN